MSGARRAWRVEVSRTVRGGGFRSSVHCTAHALGRDGRVCNADGHVIAVAGPRDAPETFLTRCRDCVPPLAIVDTLTMARPARAGTRGKGGRGVCPGIPGRVMDIRQVHEVEAQRTLAVLDARGGVEDESEELLP
ncbi:acylphosphatase [Streptomyces sp. NPDC058872]|uniref:acylphosphatase n=1 Tax=Streptomyces sp. NPDC058872 TaxID=3346661 RepID=UPI0036C0098B